MMLHMSHIAAILMPKSAHSAALGHMQHDCWRVHGLGHLTKQGQSGMYIASQTHTNAARKGCASCKEAPRKPLHRCSQRRLSQLHAHAHPSHRQHDHLQYT